MGLLGKSPSTGIDRIKEIIDGVIYDTEQASLLSSHKYALHSKGDDSVQHLYYPQHGNWFLIRPDNYVHRVAPMSPDEAYIWLAQFQEVDILEKFFADRLTQG